MTVLPERMIFTGRYLFSRSTKDLVLVFGGLKSMRSLLEDVRPKTARE
jgi:hypothetical protein